MNGDPANSGQTDRADLVGDPNAVPGGSSVAQFFNTPAFQANKPFTYGNLGRNAVMGPGFGNVDFSDETGGTFQGGGPTFGLAVPLGVFQHLQPSKFRLPRRYVWDTNFWAVNQRQSWAEDAGRTETGLLMVPDREAFGTRCGLRDRRDVSLRFLKYIVVSSGILALLSGTAMWAPAAPQAGTAANAAPGIAPTSVEWPVNRGDSGGGQRADLAQINAANVHKLKVAWEFHTGDGGGGRGGSMYTNPLVVDGVMYIRPRRTMPWPSMLERGIKSGNLSHPNTMRTTL